MTAVYRDMDQAQLDAAYNNQAVAVPDFQTVLANCRNESKAFYAGTDGERDLRYGDKPRQRFDWIPSGSPDAPTFVFIHGGYWQACTKEDFAFGAAGPLARGFNVVLAEYSLAPEVSMTEIVAEIGELLDYLAADPDNLGTKGRPLCLSGHSAGGHLAAAHRRHPLVAGSLAISGLYDLEPIRLSYLDRNLKLTGLEIRNCSPIRHVGDESPAVISVGAAELPGLVGQTDEYVSACASAGEKVIGVRVAGCRHFDMVTDLSKADGVQMAKLAELGIFRM